MCIRDRQTGKCPLYGVRPPEDGELLLYAADLQGGKGGLCENRIGDICPFASVFKIGQSTVEHLVGRIEEVDIAYARCV